MDLLPPPEQRVWLIEQLLDLLDRAGRARFLEAPLLEAGPELVGDWSANRDAARAVLAQLLGHAGLGDLDLTLEVDDTPPQVVEVGMDGQARETRHAGTAAWFAGIDGRTCRFGVELRSLEGADGGLGPLSHEVAHAWRHHHALVQSDPELEELLTDLSTIYLGAGVFAVNATWQVRTRSVGNMSSLSNSSAGYLSPQAMSFLFGAQLAARDISRRQRWRILGQLEPNQRAMVTKAVDHFRHGPGRRHLHDLRHDDCDTSGELIELPRGAHPVERVSAAQTVPGAMLGLLIGGLAGIIGTVALGEGQSMVFLLLGPMLGALIGSTIRRVRCSGCHTVVGEEDALCRGCGGLLMG